MFILQSNFVSFKVAGNKGRDSKGALKSTGGSYLPDYIRLNKSYTLVLVAIADWQCYSISK